MNVRFPYQIDERGRTAAADEARHLRDLIEQILFTSPGERVMRPNFGSGVGRLVFEPASDVLAVTAKQTIQAALQQWLADRAEVTGVEVEADDAAVRIEVEYRARSNGEMRRERFERRS